MLLVILFLGRVLFASNYENYKTCTIPLKEISNLKAEHNKYCINHVQNLNSLYWFYYRDQKQTSSRELYKQILLKSASNYLKLLSFKTGFKTKIHSKFFSKKFYVSFLYYKDNEMRMDLPTTLLTGVTSISIKNGKCEFITKAIKNQTPQEVLDIVLKISEIFDGFFYKQFVDAKVTQKGKHVIYSKDDKELILNFDTALIEKFSNKDLTVNISKYNNFVISKVPMKIKFTFKNVKIKGVLEATKIFPITDDEQNENNSQSSGKD